MDERNVTSTSATSLHANGHVLSPHPATARATGDEGECAQLPVSLLLPADSPRLAGEDEEHIRLLAESDGELPPILVHRETMRVVDGMHRLRAAMLRGAQTIRVRLFDGSQEAAFVAAVEANVAHGLPLSLADREAAAARILAEHPQWSDRAIASVVGISAKTVGTIRRGVVADRGTPDVRVGRDGRVRPVNGAEGRRRAGELFARSPNASLREVAREAGISPGTARDVRARMRRGEDPIRPRQVAAAQQGARATPRQGRRVQVPGRVGDSRDRATILRGLRRDPAVRFTDSGRGLLRWLDTHAVGVEGWEEVAPAVPAHCGHVMADLARAVAEEWLEVAERLRRTAERIERSSAEPGPDGAERTARGEVNATAAVVPTDR